jgi:DNA invertase Pin-like site-specific DNA recombinase
MRRSTRRRQLIAGEPLIVVGYVRVSTAEQADSGAGLEAQRAAILAEVERRGWTLLDVLEDAGISGKATDNRPGLAIALDALYHGLADALVVAKLDRLSRSLGDAVALLERSGREGWRLLALDLAVDTTTPQGEMIAHVMASFAQFERRLISQRTRDALAVRRAQGVRLGRPTSIPTEVVQRIVAMRASGTTQAAIADRLNADGVPTGRGGACWRQSSIAKVLRYAAEDDVKSLCPVPSWGS